jgi:hypothetical protein
VPIARRTDIAGAVLLAAALAPTGAAAAPPAYTVTPGPYRAAPQFHVTYAGSGSWRTTFLGTPPNPGGHNDRNEARDSSTQRWSLRFKSPLRVPACGGGAADRGCTAPIRLARSAGAASATGRIDHRHDDGLYPQLDRTVRCTVRSTPVARPQPAPAVSLRYDAEAQRFAISARDPVSGPLQSLPPACPKQGDSIDRILDNYFTPGFSFATGFGPERWFASGEVRLPARAVLQRAAKITVRLADVPAGRPPLGCARPHPSYERCTTTGRWHGVLTLTAAG